MVVDVGVLGVMPDSGLKVTKSGGSVAELHVHAGNLDPSLDKVGLELESLLEVLLGALRVADEELEGTPEVESLGLVVLGRDALLDGLVGERVGVDVVRRSQCVECLGQRLVTLRWVLRGGGLVVGAEGREVRRDESGRRELGLAGLKNLLGLLSGKVLEASLDRSSGLLVLEPLDDRGSGEV